MAGTIFGLGLSQRVNLKGAPESGWKLYLYAAASSTPVNSYLDSGLSILNTWPLAADAFGMMPQFWLADGSYRARGVSKDGSRVFFDIQSVLALGPSSGSGGGGSTVDPNAIFATGDVMWQPVAGVRSGWVRDNGRTVGSATSGATERANTDCQALFLWGWADGWSVVGGSGASAAADWAANKQITLPDKRGYVPGGLDDMGNSAASRFTGVPVVSGSVTSAGSVVGESRHALSQSELPIITPAGTIGGQSSDDVAHGSPHDDLVTSPGTSGWRYPDTPTPLPATGFTFIGTPFGGNGSHNTTQLTVLGTFYRKL